jgi:ApeA N-terminal domain 1
MGANSSNFSGVMPAKPVPAKAGSGIQFVAETVLLNSTCKSTDEPMFTHMVFASPALTAFYDPQGINVRYPKKMAPTYRASYKRPQPLKSKWQKNRIVLTSNAHLPMRQARDGSLQIFEQASYEVAFHAPASLNDVLRHLSAIEFFLGLAVGQFSGVPSGFVLSKVDSRASRSMSQLLRSRRWYVPFDHSTYRATHVSARDLSTHAMPLLSRWFDLYGRIERITDIYRASQHIPGIESQFLFAVQALEGLHRICLPRNAIADQEFDRGIQALRSAIPADFTGDVRQFFVSRLNLLNEPGLSRRLRDFLRLVKQSVPMGLEHVDRDIDGIVALRNEFSHGSLGTGSQVIDLQILHYYLGILQALFEIGLFRILEVPQSIISDIYYANPRYSHLEMDRRRLAKAGRVPMPRRK